jgi:glycosyl hydrolase family 39 (putative alpha-L-iduronidase)
MRVRFSRLPVAVLAALALLFALAGGTAQGAESGVVLNGTAGFSTHGSTLIHDLGVGWVRMFLSWKTFEPSRGHIDQGEMSWLESELAGLPAGTKTVIVVVDTPQWASGSSNQLDPPSDAGDYGHFVGAMAKRLAGRVAAWEIWNEEDAPLWWPSGPDPAAYTAILKASHRAIKQADPKAKVVLGGLTGNDYEYLEELYAHGAEGSFDAVAVHTDTACNVVSPYTILRNGRTDRRINRWSFLGYRTVHEVMQAHGDGSPIWMTELGWSTDSHICASGAHAGQKPGGVSPLDSATYLLQAYHCLAQDSYVRVGIVYGLEEEPFATHGGFGLLDTNLTPKPAYGALADYSRNGDRLTEPCGAEQGPKVTLVRPKTGVRYTNTLSIAVTASDSAGVYEISLFGDGHLIRNFYVHGGLPTLSGQMVWHGARLLKPGKHLLTARAYNELNNAGSTSITIVRGVTHKKHKHHHRGKGHRLPKLG